MKIKCKKTNRFLCEINIEDYLKNLESIGISQQLPLTIKIPCKNCKETEYYEIYSTHYILKKTEKKNK